MGLTLSVVLWLGIAVGSTESASNAWTLLLSWDAPRECPDAEAIRREVNARAHDPRGTIEATGVVTRDTARGTFVLELTVHGAAEPEQRRIESRSCDALGEAAGLLIAAAADPVLASASDPGDLRDGVAVFPAPSRPSATPTSVASPRRSPSGSGDPPRPQIEGPPPPSRPTHAERKLTHRWAPAPRGGLLRLEGVGQLFPVLPRGGLGLGGAGGLTLGRARIELRGHYYVPQREVYAENPEITGDFDLWTLGAAGCWGPSRGRWSFPLCGGAEAGAMRGRTGGVRRPGDGRSAWLGATVDGAVTYSPVTHMALRMGAQGVVAVLRPKFHVRELDTLFRAGAAGMRVGFGVEVRFP